MNSYDLGDLTPDKIFSELKPYTEICENLITENYKKNCMEIDKKYPHLMNSCESEGNFKIEECESPRATYGALGSACFIGQEPELSFDGEIVDVIQNKKHVPLVVHAFSNDMDKIWIAEGTQKALRTYAIKCANCEQIFSEKAFSFHVCEYDSNKNFIPDGPIVSEEEIKKEPLVTVQRIKLEDSNEPACLRLLRENQIKIRRYLKGELKIDLFGNTPKKQDGPHECTMCERKFVHASGLSRHMEKHALDLIPSNSSSSEGCGLKVVIKCTFCGRVFFEPGESISHLLKDHITDKEELDELEKIDTIRYEQCLAPALELIKKKEGKGEEYPLPSNRYLKLVILSCILQCEFCDNLFTEVSCLLKHTTCHDPHKGFQCFACEISVPTSKEIFLHWQAECVFAREAVKKNYNLQRYFVCNVCETKFVTCEQLHEHRYSSYHFFPRTNKVLGTLQSPCEYCGQLFSTVKELIAHYEEKHLKKSKKETSGKYRQYLCDVCGKSYTQSSHLWQHLRFHKGVKPFSCKVPDCNRSFTIRPDLNDHIRKCHTGERPYHCLECGKRFLTGSVFYQHRLIHRGERRYGCDDCGKRFYRADALKNHQRIHTGEKPFPCMYCAKKFRQRGDRDKHTRARHSNLDANAKLLMQMRNLQQNSGSSSKDDVVFVGNIPFPGSMFKPMVADIDGDEK